MAVMTVQNTRERLHSWIDKLPPRQVDLIYRLVEELMLDEQQDETEYLLSSNKMRERLLAARDSDEVIPLEEVREKLRI